MATFKLFDFQIIHEKSNEDQDIDQDQDDTNDDDNYSFSNTKSNLVFAIQMFGINEIGETASIIVEGFQPFFYVKVPPRWGQANMKEFRRHIEKQIKPYFAKHITECKLIEKKKLYGFDGGRLHRFIKFSFRNMQTFNKVKNLWFSSTTKRDESGSEQREYGIKKEGYIFNGQRLELYEANIPPLLRFFHIKNISPSGWIELPMKKIRATPQGNKKTSCTFEFRIHYNDIIPLNHIDTLVPYKIMSFDIEASSSHGDFPVPKKTYKKLATNIVDFFEKNNAVNISECLPKIILKAFGYAQEESKDQEPDSIFDMIDFVYPKTRPTREKLLEKIERLCTFQNDADDVINTDADNNDDQYIENLFEAMHKAQQMQNAARNDHQDDEAATQAEKSDQDDNSSDDDIPEPAEDEPIYTPIVRRQAAKRTTTKGTIFATLSDSDTNRETKICELLRLFKRAAFPPLEGDKITFIGSTFMKYGQKEPYFQHCIVLNSCATASTTTIESYETEAEVLLAWRNLVQRENPDIVVGYNIFNFDYEFMFRRAEELDIVAEFLQLSRNRDELCIAATNSFQSQQTEGACSVDIERSSITLASGTYELAIIKMNGRLQIDMLNWFRRTENLSSYKLDKVASKYIGDVVLTLEHKLSPIGEITRIKTNNMTGLQCGNFIHFEEINHSSNEYKNGAKFQVISLSLGAEKWFDIAGHEMPKAKIVKWGLAKDDIEPKDIFRLTNEGAESRALVAKYCIQDCNLVHYLFNKVDVMTDLIEMSRLCSIPMSFLIFRGQGIKLTSYMAKKCREKGVLMPVIAKGSKNDAYEGAIVLEPKCGLYLDNPAAVGDFSSLYPSCAISENLCPSTKVWTKIYNLLGELIEERGEKDPKTGEFIYDNLPGYRYVDVQCDTYRYIRKHPKAKAEKIVSGYKICRFVQPIKRPDGTMEYGIVPSILQECLKARKDTRKLIPQQTDEFMKNVLDKRQQAYKVTANSLYGQLGAKTSTFYEMDIASAITATGRKLLTYAKRIVETCYSNTDILTGKYGWVHTNAEYIYGDTDSVFFTFNLSNKETGERILGQQALELSIEIAQEACANVSKFLKPPHDFAYEKTFLPFCLLSKKRYVGMLYETNPNKGKRKEMGIVLKRRDNAPIVKDIYGGVIDILMKERNIQQAMQYVDKWLQDLVAGNVSTDKLIISKSLNSFYKKPNQIAHKVLADRIAAREPGNKPAPGDRIPFLYITHPNRKALQGEKIETPTYIREHNLQVDYSFYITNQIMKPLLQLFGLVLEDIWRTDHKLTKISKFRREVEKIKLETEEDKKMNNKITKLRNMEVQALLFDKYLRNISNKKDKNAEITRYFKRK